ncbi:hypothetical protein ACFYYH_30385 [Streptomyces sp. NPDC002018]|uniref:hypothetical protein n=1 Tax=Streptomyces sp. NPDC002018 TaxID=3364629 RepID=UPI00369B5581
MSRRTAFWERAAEAAVDVPAAGGERASWVTRNLAELALMMEVADGPVELLDRVTGQSDLRGADPRFATRLRLLRSRRGEVPGWYPEGTRVRAGRGPLSPRSRGACEILLRFAARLHGGPAGTETATGAREEVSALEGGGAAAVARRARWRPLPSSAVGHCVVPVDVPATALWRAWMTLPDRGIVRVVADERLSREDMDVWWGVHDGTHLDHLASFGTAGLTPVEFGRGLLVTEALAMAAELLAAAEALADGEGAVQASVRSGLVERVARVPVAANPARALLPEESGAEFGRLPTLALAYVVGPLDLLATGFRHILIPRQVADGFRDRWHRAEHGHPAVRALIEQTDEWWARHDRS